MDIEVLDGILLDVTPSNRAFTVDQGIPLVLDGIVVVDSASPGISLTGVLQRIRGFTRNVGRLINP